MKQQRMKILVILIILGCLVTAGVLKSRRTKVSCSIDTIDIDKQLVGKFLPSSPKGFVGTPTLTLFANHCFTMRSFPPTWLREFSNAQAVDADGTWVIIGDGDGSLVVKFILRAPRLATDNLVARIGLVPNVALYSDDASDLRIPELDKVPIGFSSSSGELETPSP